MKLNYDCVRDALLFIESVDYIQDGDDCIVEFKEIDIDTIFEALPQYRHAEIYYALFNLEQAEMINATSQSANSGVYVYFVNYITYPGHEFLDRIKPPTVWESTKSVLSKAGTMSIDIITQVASNVLTNFLFKP